MSGIYIHIPFCKSRCIYCDFYSTTLLNKRDAYIKALLLEIGKRNDYLNDKNINTLYFGGGTPSLLDEQQFISIFEALRSNYDLSGVKECTIEANPDDLSPDYLSMLKNIGFNRLSIGIQTFNDEILKTLYRRNNSEQSLQALTDAGNAGFGNISVDLIYGLPGQTFEIWQKDVEQAIEAGITHISAYGLTFEPGTRLHLMMEKGQIAKPSDETYLSYYDYLINRLKKAGFIHYEISNFCKPGYYSIHNSSYWKSIEYIGFGPSAHSYNGKERQWNDSSLNKYINAICNDKQYFEAEELDRSTRYNDYIVTALRTMWGINLDIIKERFGKEFSDYCLKNAKPHIERGKLKKDKQQLKLSEDGVFVSDDIMCDLIWVE